VVAGCGRGADRLFQAWQAQASAIRPLRRFEAARYQSGLAGEVAEADLPAQGFWVERLAAAALEDALAESRDSGLKPGTLGLVLATAKGNLDPVEAGVAGKACASPCAPEALGRALEARFGLNVAFIRTVSLACASGAVAIAYAAEVLERREADAVAVVGVDALSDFVLTGFSSLKSLDPGVCRPFDQSRCGLSLGEAGAALVLGREESIRRPVGKIAGWGGANDANHLTAPSRDGSGLAKAIGSSMRRAGIRPDFVHYINAHGTGTVYNDAMEAKAVAAVFGKQTPPISTLKSITGHTLGAAGVLETIATLKALAAGQAPATWGLETPGVEEPVDLIIREPRCLPKGARALSLFAGFGGFNASLVLEAA